MARSCSAPPNREVAADKRRLQLWAESVSSEARARVGVLFEEQDDWFAALRAELEGRETVARGDESTEEKAV